MPKGQTAKAKKPAAKAGGKSKANPAKKPVPPEQLETLNVRTNAGHKYKPGNRFWEMRSSFGRKPIFASAEQLWNAATEYFDWVEQNPLYESKPFAYQGKVVQESVAKMRIMTIQGLCLFLDISDETWSNLRKRPAFFGITEQIEKVIREQGIAGASADLLNPMIVARVLGLKESIEARVTEQTDLSSLDDAELTAVKAILAKAGSRLSA